jgi:uncharacterized protein
MMHPKPTSIDDYIARSDEAARAKLTEIRTLIKTTAPEAEERIWYHTPFFFLRGRELIGFDAMKSHVSFGYGPGVMSEDDRKRLAAKGYKTGKGTLQIRFDQELPVEELQAIIRAKAKSNEAK